MKLSILFVVLLTAACSFSYRPSSPSDDVEAMLLSETARFAGMLKVAVHGEMTDSISAAQREGLEPKGYPAGWYLAGVAWYYRPQVKRFVTLEPEAGHETATNVAAHEVCHAVSPWHDLQHWRCSRDIAVPTYPMPGVGIGHYVTIPLH